MTSCALCAYGRFLVTIPETQTMLNKNNNNDNIELQILSVALAEYNVVSGVTWLPVLDGGNLHVVMH